MMKTLYDARADVNTFLVGETVAAALINIAINDAIESLWQSLIRAQLSNQMGGPVTISVAAADQRVLLASIADPTTAPTVAGVAGGTLAQHTIYSCYTLATDSGSETLPSATQTTVILVNTLAKMTSPSFVAGALGWNCYMGTASGRMAKQNTDPVAFGTDYTEATTGATILPDAPGVPTENTTYDDLFYIRRIEAVTPVGTYLSWDAADLDSAMMRSAAGQIAAASQYQTYVWDLIDQRQLELRPVVALAASPRYFYVKKPRRLAYDGSVIPFSNLPVSEFIRVHSLKSVFMALREWDAVKAYGGQAESARATLVAAVAQQNTPKNQTIAPFMYA